MILGIIIILLDGLIIYSFPGYFNNLNYFYPMLTLTYCVFLVGNKIPFRTIFILGFIYDLFYSSIFLYNALLFFSLAKIDKFLLNYLPNNLFNKIIILIINIVLYDLMGYFIVAFTKYNIVSLNDLFYKISHSLLLNIIFLIILYIIKLKRKVS